MEKLNEQKGYQTFLTACSVLALEYAGHSFLLQEPSTRIVTKATISITVNFFIPDTILIIHKNILFIQNTIFVPRIISYSF
jgi:hypothetical protein